MPDSFSPGCGSREKKLQGGYKDPPSSLSLQQQQGYLKTVPAAQQCRKNPQRQDGCLAFLIVTQFSKRCNHYFYKNYIPFSVDHGKGAGPCCNCQWRIEN